MKTRFRLIDRGIRGGIQVADELDSGGRNLTVLHETTRPDFRTHLVPHRLQREEIAGKPAGNTVAPVKVQWRGKSGWAPWGPCHL